MYGMESKYNMPLFKPFATLLPPCNDASAEALHIGHCAINGSEKIKKVKQIRKMANQTLLKTDG